MDKLFLDANLLFSAAYKKDAGRLRFWPENLSHHHTAASGLFKTTEEQLGEYSRLDNTGELARMACFPTTREPYA